MRAALRILPFSIACLTLSSIASAQQPPPHPMPGPGVRLAVPPGMTAPSGVAGGRGPGFPAGFGPGGPMGPGARQSNIDCVVTALGISSQVRRSEAVVDVSVRVKSVKGGACLIRPDAVQVTTQKSSGATKLISYDTVGGQRGKLIAVADAPGFDRLRPFVEPLKANEEREVVFRFVVEGDVQPNGDIDAPAKVRVDMRSLGPRVLNGAPMQARVSLEPGSKGLVALNMGSPKSAVAPRPVNADGTVALIASFSREDLLPMVEWRYEAAPPAAAEAEKLNDGGLASLEYLREGIARDLANGYADAKDEKKIAAAWDAAFDAAYTASQSEDAIVAGLGARTFAWLASGLSPAATGVRSADDAAAQGVPVPAKIAAAINKAGADFQAATGQRIAPSPAGARTARPYLAKLGEPGSQAKAAEEALKRFEARFDEGKLTGKGGELIAHFPQLVVPGSLVRKSAQIITWGARGPMFVVTGRVEPPKNSMINRVVRVMSRPRSLAKGFVSVVVIGGLGYLGYLWLQRRKRAAQAGAAAEQPIVAAETSEHAEALAERFALRGPRDRRSAEPL